MTVGNKVTAYKYNKNDELLRTDTLSTDTERDSVVLYKYDKNGNQLAIVNRYEIPSDKKDSAYIDIDVTLGDNRLNENVVNHYNAENQLIQTLTNLLGIHADKKYAAKALAFVLKANSKPEVHGKENYGHYHDKNHLIHIWYGEPVIKPYDRLARAVG